MRKPKLKLLGAALMGAALFSPAVHAGPIDVFKSFNAVIFQNFTSQSSDVEGTLAVGGNATLYNYSINHSNAPYNGYGLVVGGNLNFTNGTVWNGGKTYYGGTLSGSAVNYTGGTVTHPTASPVNFDALHTSAASISSDYAHLGANGITSYITPDPLHPLSGGNPDGLNLEGDGMSALQVFSIDGSLLGGRNEIALSHIPSFASIVLNVSGFDTGLHGLDGIDSSNPFDPYAGHVLFNFYEATKVFFDHTAPHASILAPLATIDSTQYGHITGTVVANEWNGAFQLNVVAVPEPETYVLMLAGLGMMGFAACRRRQQASAAA